MIRRTIIQSVFFRVDEMVEDGEYPMDGVGSNRLTIGKMEWEDRKTTHDGRMAWEISATTVVALLLYPLILFIISCFFGFLVFSDFGGGVSSPPHECFSPCDHESERIN